MQHGKQEHTRVVEQFVATDFGTPFQVVLHNSVRVTSAEHDGEAINYTIPHPDGLIRAIVSARIMHERKLSGSDIKWLRKAVSSKQKEVAVAISMTPEHLSRCEAGTLVMSPGSEKLLRLYLFKKAAKLHAIRECEEKRKLEQLLECLFAGHDPVAAFDSSEELVLHFERRFMSSSAQAGNDNDDGWDDVKSAING